MQEAVKIIRGKTLIDGNGGAPLEDPVIVVEGKRVKEVRTAKGFKAPAGAEELDCTSHVLMPGMMDLHIHLCMFNVLTFKNYRVAQWEVGPELQQMYMLFHGQLCLDRGFTTLRDLGYISASGLMTSNACAVRDAIDAGIIPGPRIVVGAFTTGTGTHLDLVNPRSSARNPEATGDGADAMRRLSRKNLLKGADVLKTCASGGGGTDKEEPDIRNHTQDELNAIVDEAHAQHKRCAVHCFTPDAQRMALDAGADTIEHMVFHSDEMIDRIIETGTPVTPTLLHRTDHAIELRKQIGTPEFIINKMKQIQPHCFETFQKMYKAGVKIAMGTDMGFEPGFGTNASELAVYVQLGMKPIDAISTATRNAADALGKGADLGTIENGKFADIIAVAGNPLDDIRVLEPRENIQLVMKEGDVYIDRRPGHPGKEVIHGKMGAWKIIDK